MEERKSTLYFIPVIAVLLAVPFFFCRIPPLADFPNHLARLHILTSIADSPALRQFYSVDNGFVANMAMEIIMLPWLSFMSTELAGQIFAYGGIVLLFTGALAVNYSANNRFSVLLACAMGIMAYNKFVRFGFMNYIFTMGMVFWCFAFWMRLRDMAWYVRLAWNIVASMTIGFCHMHALATYCVLVAGYEVNFVDWRDVLGSLKRYVAVVLPLAAVCAFFLVFTSTGGNALAAIRYEFVAKFKELVTVLYAYNLSLDLGVTALVGAVFLYLLLTRQAAFNTKLIIPCAFVFGLFLALPYQLFTVVLADVRMTPVIVMLLLAGLSVRMRSQAVKRGLTAVMVALLIVRTAFTAMAWKDLGTDYDDLYAFAGNLKPGDRVLSLVAETDRFRWGLLQHSPSVLVLAEDVFTNCLFGNPGQQRLQVLYNQGTDYSRDPSHMVLANRMATETVELPFDRFDYVLLVNTPYFADKDIAWSRLTLVSEANGKALYRINTGR